MIDDLTLLDGICWSHSYRESDKLDYMRCLYNKRKMRLSTYLFVVSFITLFWYQPLYHCELVRLTSTSTRPYQIVIPSYPSKSLSPMNFTIYNANNYTDSFLLPTISSPTNITSTLDLKSSPGKWIPSSMMLYIIACLGFALVVLPCIILIYSIIRNRDNFKICGTIKKISSYVSCC